MIDQNKILIKSKSNKIGEQIMKHKKHLERVIKRTIDFRYMPAEVLK